MPARPPPVRVAGHPVETQLSSLVRLEQAEKGVVVEIKRPQQRQPRRIPVGQPANRLGVTQKRKVPPHQILAAIPRLVGGTGRPERPPEAPPGPKRRPPTQAKPAFAFGQQAPHGLPPLEVSQRVKVTE